MALRVKFYSNGPINANTAIQIKFWEARVVIPYWWIGVLTLYTSTDETCRFKFVPIQGRIATYNIVYADRTGEDYVLMLNATDNKLEIMRYAPYQPKLSLSPFHVQIRKANENPGMTLAAGEVVLDNNGDQVTSEGEYLIFSSDGLSLCMKQEDTVLGVVVLDREMAFRVKFISGIPGPINVNTSIKIKFCDAAAENWMPYWWIAMSILYTSTDETCRFKFVPIKIEGIDVPTYNIVYADSAGEDYVLMRNSGDNLMHIVWNNYDLNPDLRPLGVQIHNAD